MKLSSVTLYALSRRARVVTLTGAAIIALASIAAATRYSRAEPTPATDPPGLGFGSDGIRVASDAPAWSSLAIEHPRRAAVQWSDPIPARVAFDESRTSRVGAPIGGRITNVFVEAGEAVSAGAPLFQIASSGLAELHGDIAKAEIEIRGANVNLERTQALVDSGSLPGKELVVAKQALDEAELAGQLAHQKLAALRVTSSSDSALTVVAPRDGVVVEKHAAVGQQVDVTTGDLIAIADVSRVWVLADLFENDAAGVHVGAAVKVITDDEQTDRDASIEQVSAIVDPERHTVPIRIRLSNADGALRPNAHARVRLLVREDGLTVPGPAVLSDGVHSYVYVAAADGTMRRRDVVVSATASDGVVSVASGLSLDDRVVVKGAILLDNAIQLHDE